MYTSRHYLQGALTLLRVRIVEFASQEDSQRAIRELSEQPLLGRPVFIREVRFQFAVCAPLTHGSIGSGE
jgi:hypothetical protein